MSVLHTSYIAKPILLMKKEEEIAGIELKYPIFSQVERHQGTATDMVSRDIFQIFHN